MSFYIFCSALGVAACVCVLCFRPFYFGGKLIPLIKARRALHFAAYLEDYTCSAYPTVQLEPTGVTQDGVNTGAFSSFYAAFMPHRRPPAVLAFIFYREKGSAVPVPRQHQSRILSSHEAFQLYIAFHYQVYAYESEKKIHSRRESNPWRGCQKVTGTPTRPPGRPAACCPIDSGCLVCLGPSTLGWQNPSRSACFTPKL